jgi:hypothetical protein
MLKGAHGYTIQAGDDIDPSMGHYLVLSITAGNRKRLDYPSVTGALRWSDPGAAYGTGQALFDIYIDGDAHNYYIPLGLKQDWHRSAAVSDLSLEIPQLDGIDIEVNRAALKKRLFFPVDICLAGLLDSPVIPGYAEINSFLMPSYILLLIIIMLAGIYYLLYRKQYAGTAAPGRLAARTVLISILLILLFFSATYIYGEAIALKSYWTAYGDDLVSGSLEETYTGIYEFEKFIAWTNGTIPEDRSIIVFVKGEPVYIMSEMAFNMYPRDIWFLDISGRTFDEVKSEIESVPGNRHDHLVILSRDDTYLASGYKLIARYRSDGGYIYSLK